MTSESEKSEAIKYLRELKDRHAVLLIRWKEETCPYGRVVLGDELTEIFEECVKLSVKYGELFGIN